MPDKKKWVPKELKQAVKKVPRVKRQIAPQKKGPFILEVESAETLKAVKKYYRDVIRKQKAMQSRRKNK